MIAAPLSLLGVLCAQVCATRVSVSRLATSSSVIVNGVTYSFDGSTLTITGSTRVEQTGVEQVTSGAGGISTIESVSVGPDITVIGAQSFYQCRNMVSVRLPDGLEYIEESAFNSCPKLESPMVMPKRLQAIGQGAFAGCAFSGALRFHNQVSSIGSMCFVRCARITSILFTSPLDLLGSFAFSTCSAMVSIQFVKIGHLIKEGTFQSCSALRRITYCTTSDPGVAPVSGERDGPFYGCELGLIMVYVPFGYSTAVGCGRFCRWADDLLPIQEDQYFECIEHLPTDTFTVSASLSDSHAFTGSSGFVATQAFSASMTFTSSSSFAESDAFSRSSPFTLSGIFTKSGGFSRSSTFTHSRSFSMSLTFTHSADFSMSNEFSKSSTFTPSEGFSASMTHASSRQFSESNAFAETKPFTKTDGFEPTNSFTELQTSPSVFVSETRYLSASEDSVGESPRLETSLGSTSSYFVSSTQHIQESVSTSTYQQESTALGSSKQQQASRPRDESASSPTASTADESGGGGVNIGMIVGIVFGLLALIAIVIILVLFLVIRKRKEAQKTSEAIEGDEFSNETVDLSSTTETGVNFDTELNTAENPLFVGDTALGPDANYFNQSFEEAAEMSFI